MAANLNVKVGDKVLYYDRWNGDRITTVVKITASGNIRTANGGYFNPDGRVKSSDSWAISWIRELTEEDEIRLRMKSIRQHVIKADYRKLSDEDIEAIYKILMKYEGE